MALTPHSRLQEWLVLALGDLDGSAQRRVALARISERFGSEFTETDIEPVASRPHERKWQNRVSWQRDRMVKAGLLDRFEIYGTPWSLTETGWALHDALSGSSRTADEHDSFEHFKPKDSSDYQAFVEAAVFTKKRSHEDLVANFGRWCIERGFAASTAEHPIDLLLRRSGVEWLVEAKVVYRGNATQAVRAALAQALIYAYFRPGSPPRLVALFSEPVGDAYVGFLESYGVASVWAADSGWDGSPTASALLADT